VPYSGPSLAPVKGDGRGRRSSRGRTVKGESDADGRGDDQKERAVRTGKKVVEDENRCDSDLGGYSRRLPSTLMEASVETNGIHAGSEGTEYGDVRGA
jgi:hypothetical protein